MTIRKEHKPKWLLPGDIRPLDTTVQTVHVGSAILMALVATVFVTSLVLLLSWSNYPFFPAPPSERPPVFHVQAFWLVLAGLTSKLFQGEVFHYYGA